MAREHAMDAERVRARHWRELGRRMAVGPGLERGKLMANGVRGRRTLRRARIRFLILSPVRFWGVAPSCGGEAGPDGSRLSVALGEFGSQLECRPG